MTPAFRRVFRAGARALTHWPILLLLTAVPAVLGLLAAIPLWPALARGFGETLAGDHVLRNHPTFAAADVFDFVRQNWAVLAGARASAAASAVLGVLFQILLTGGLVVVLGRSDRSPERFVGGVLRNLGHNLACFLLFLAIAALALGLWAGAGALLFGALFDGTPPGTRPRFAFGVAHGAVALAIFGAATLLHDLARGLRRADAGIRTARAYRAALRIVARRPGAAFGAWALWGGGGIVAGLLLFAVSWGWAPTSAFGIAALFFVQLATLGARSAARLAKWGSLLSLVDESSGFEPRRLRAPVLPQGARPEPSVSAW